MSSFLRIEERSTLLGSREMTVVFIPISEVHKILLVEDNGEAIVWYGTPTESTHAATIEVVNDIAEAIRYDLK